jgi:hypothetical protein
VPIPLQSTLRVPDRVPLECLSVRHAARVRLTHRLTHSALRVPSEYLEYLHSALRVPSEYLEYLHSALRVPSEYLEYLHSALRVPSESALVWTRSELPRHRTPLPSVEWPSDHFALAVTLSWLPSGSPAGALENAEHA